MARRARGQTGIWWICPLVNTAYPSVICLLTTYLLFRQMPVALARVAPRALPDDARGHPAAHRALDPRRSLFAYQRVIICRLEFANLKVPNLQTTYGFANRVKQFSGLQTKA